jgi:hypothetical protein
MSLFDWLREVRGEIDEYPPSNIIKHAGHKFYLGGLRRVQSILDRGVSHWDEEWDVLVICDACRVDLLKEVCASGEFGWLPGPTEVDTILSTGSTSDEWMEGMFGEERVEEMNHTAYVSGNLFVRNHPFDEFAAYVEIEPEQVGDIHTVDPDRITESAVSLWRNREELGIKQMIVHYMQPHTPFRSRPEWFDPDRQNRTTWGEGFARLRDGELDFDEFREAYLDNTVWAMEAVGELQQNLAEADIVVSADHGNALGEYGVFGHPYGMPIDAVRRVPWLRIEGTDEFTLNPGQPSEYLDKTVDEDDIEEQLSALGYR